jgi:hypothetical protein
VGLLHSRRNFRQTALKVARSDTQLTGSAGEFLVAGELGQRSWVPSITPRGIEQTDILAQHSATGHVVALQVKTASVGNFRLGRKNEAPARQWNEWYVFVALAEIGSRARFFIVPTNVVAALLYVGHRVWLAGAKRDGTARKDSAIRAISVDQIDGYEEAWNLLLAPADAAPVRVPEWILKRGGSDIGWPEGHPGLVQS